MSAPGRAGAGCPRFATALDRYVAPDALDDEDAREFAEHMERCKVCYGAFLTRLDGGLPPALRAAHAHELQVLDGAARARAARPTGHASVRRIARGVAAVAVAAGVALALRSWPEHDARRDTLGGRGAPEAVGSPREVAVQPEPGADVRLEAAGADVVRYEVRRGRARFSVREHRTRRVRVVAAGVVAEVRGTTFSVEALVAGARVTVDEGVVEVGCGADGVLIGRGRELRWRCDGPEPAERERQNAEELWRLAEDAWQQGHPRDAVAVLRRMLRDSRSTPLAPTAAWQLGHILRHELHDPLGAAEAFALARALAPEGPHAQEARRQEVECRALARGDAGGGAATGGP